MNSRRELENRLKNQGEPVQPLEVNMEELAEHIAEVSQTVCSALVKRGFSQGEAVRLASQIIPNLI